MTRLTWKLLLTAAVGLLFPARLASGIEAHALPAAFSEVYELIRSNLSGVTEPELEQAALAGLIKQLQPRVELAPQVGAGELDLQRSCLAKTILFDDSILYLRIERVAGDLAANLKAVLAMCLSTNDLKGVVFDLRFASGTDYAAAAAVADLFAASEGQLLDWSTGAARATAKTNAFTLPVAVLVNSRTAEAAEALAALLREVGVGLIIGTNTAGRAFVMDEFELKTGQRLRVAKAAVKFGDGQPLPPGGLKPDIAVAVQPENELVYLENAYRQIVAGEGQTANGDGSATNGGVQTNRNARRRLNEAELMREHREGSRLGRRVRVHGAEEAEKPVVADPALARALDLIKGLAVIKRSQQLRR